MAKLHEVLAVEGDLAGTADKILTEAIVTFSKKPDHFIGQAVEQTYFNEADAHLAVNDAKAMVTTVADKLKYVAPAVSRYYDTYLQKEATNQLAKADLVVDDKVLLEGLPATVLLGLETKLKQVRAVYDAIPTLQPGPFWEKDPGKGEGVYRSRDPEIRFITRKEIRPIVMAPATKEHPAQITAVNEDVKIAKNEVSTWSGMLSPAEKSDLLERLDKVVRGVKRARQRANTQAAVAKQELGKTIFDYIHAGII